MRKALLATASGAALLAAGPVLADEMADKLTIGIGGYMQQWIGASSLDGGANDGGVSQYSDSEIYFRGALEADNGLTFSVKVELEANTSGDQIDESQATVSGSFGQIVIGSEDDPASLMHYGNGDVGVGLNCGDSNFMNGITGCARSDGIGLGTSGWLIGGDSQKIAYYTPRLEGVQFGFSYSPESLEDKDVGKPLHNDDNAVSLGLNFMGSLGDASIGLSAGYYEQDQTMASVSLMSGREAGNGIDPITAGELTKANADIAKYEAASGLMKHGTGNAAAFDASGLTDLQATAARAKADIDRATDTTAMQSDPQTFANFGLTIGLGSFGFDVAYAAHDGGAYEPVRQDVVVTDNTRTFDHDGNADTAEVAETATRNDPTNDRARTVLSKDTSQDYEVVSAGVNYTDGPMAVSLSHMMAEADNGDDVSATMFSFKYTLAPGIASRSTLMAGEKGELEGTAIVTGITLSF